MQDYKKIFGNYQKTYVAYSKDSKIRFNSSSGGIVTSLLISALENKIIDGAIVVGMEKNNPWKYEVKIATTKKEILSAAGSKYTLVPIAEIIRKVAEIKDKNIAVTALPCHMPALRSIQKKNPNIKILIGLFCGYNMPLDATEFFIKKSGIKKNDISNLEYRGGKFPGGFTIKTKNNKIIHYPKHYYDFLNLMFVPEGCLKCKDYMNEQSDISVGDAWGFENHSLVIVRTNVGKKFIETSDTLEIKPLKEKRLFQMHKHNIKHKKEGDSKLRTFIRKSLKRHGKIIPLWLLGSFAKLRRVILK